jgi:hypothetical protein
LPAAPKYGSVRLSRSDSLATPSCNEPPIGVQARGVEDRHGRVVRTDRGGTAAGSIVKRLLALSPPPRQHFEMLVRPAEVADVILEPAGENHNR